MLLLALAVGLLAALAVITVVAVATTSLPLSGRVVQDASQRRGVLFRDTFNGPDGVITNAYATSSGNPAARHSPNWQVQSGSLLRRHDAGWTGVPSAVQPNVNSSNGSGSEIFRMWTTRSDFGNVRVDMRLRTLRYVNGSRGWPRKSWDGVKIWLRRQQASGSPALYTAEVNRRQGNIMIQKKCAGSDRYRILALSRANRPARFGQWEHVGGSVRTTSGGAVALSVIRDGAVALTATDSGTGTGCRPITHPGRVGVRGDNADFLVDDFTVTGLGR